MADGHSISKANISEANVGIEELPLITEKMSTAIDLLTEVGEYVARVAPKHQRGVESAKLAIQDVSILLRQHAHGNGNGVHRVTAPMPGVVVRCERAVGEQVEAGDVVLILDAMKMENLITAPVAGKLLTVPHGAGQKVAKGAVLAVIA